MLVFKEKITASLLTVVVAVGCAGNQLQTASELEEARALRQTYQIDRIAAVEAEAERRNIQVIWVHPPERYGIAHYRYPLPMRIPHPFREKESATSDSSNDGG